MKKEEKPSIPQDNDDNDSPVVVKVVPAAADWKPPTNTVDTENLVRRKSPRKPSPVVKEEDQKENEGTELNNFSMHICRAF